MGVHNLLQQLFLTGAPVAVPATTDAATLTVDRMLEVFKVTTATAETRTLAQATKPGILCAIVLDADGGDLTLTVTGGYNQAGTTSLTFDDAGDWVVFYSVEVGTSFYWRVLASEGVNVVRTDMTATTGTITTLVATDLTATNSSLGTITAVPQTSAGVGTKNGATVTAAEYGDGVVHKTVLTLTNCVVAMNDEAGSHAWGGTKIYDFPAGAIQVLGAVVDLTATSSNSTGIVDAFDGDCALGTTIATNADTDLTGTEADILAKFSTNQAVSGVAAVEGQGATLVAASLNGVTAAKDLYLNYLVDDADQDITNAATNLLNSGTVTVHWINLGDIA